MSFEFNNEEPFSFSSYQDEYTILLSELHELYTKDQPEDVLQYCFNFFNNKLQEQRATFLNSQLSIDTDQHPLTRPGYTTQSYVDSRNYSINTIEDQPNDEDVFFSQDEEERDEFSTQLLSFPTPHTRNRRTSVSAESMAPTDGFVKKVIPKSSIQFSSIQKSVSHNFLFKTLDEEHHQDVVNAMVETKVIKGQVVIEQGAVGDFFYVVESGTLDCFIEKEGQTIKVTSYEEGGSFGELALMYNAPRAATIIATSDCLLWALDRVTFRTILMENTSQKRKLYESFLEEVPLFKSLELYERHKIADSLESVYFNAGDHVISQGDRGDQFYLIESGSAIVYKSNELGEQHEVNQLQRGAYFGELALLNDSPRAATVIANSRLKCATLGKKAFTRLLGHVHEILKRNSENYHAIINQQE